MFATTWCVEIFFFYYSDYSGIWKWCLGGHRSAFLLSGARQKPNLHTHTQTGSLESHCALSEFGSKLDFQLGSFRCPDPHLSKVWFLMRKSGVLTLRGWPGRASWVSPEPWQSNPALSSSGSQLPSEEDSLPPWSCVSGGDRQGGQKRSHMMTIRTMDTCSPVGSVSGAKGIVDVNVSQFGQRRPEGVDLLRGGLSLKHRIRTQM